MFTPHNSSWFFRTKDIDFAKVRRDRVISCDGAYKKSEVNEFKLQFPVPTSGGDRFRNLTQKYAEMN